MSAGAIVVLIADEFEASGIDALCALGASVQHEPSLDATSLPDAVQRHDPEILIVRSTKLQAPVFERARRLSLVVRAGAGYDNIDVQAASDRGIYVANCPGKNAIAVAELTWGLVIAADRRIPSQTAELLAGKWNKSGYADARGLHGRTLGIVGFGRIGREVALRASAFGMHVIAWSRSLTDELAAEHGAERVTELDELAQRSDVVTLHLAATDDTRKLIGRAFLDALRPGTILINTARGSVIDQAALAAAIEDKGLRVAADVWSEQPKAGDTRFADPLMRAPGVIGTHHNGASTQQAQQAIADETVRIVRHYIESGVVPNAVNRAGRTPAKSLLTVRHLNQPGVLAAVFQLIGRASINVEEMENVIYEGGRAASARIFLDAPLPAAALGALGELEHVLSAQQSSIAR